MNNTASEKKNTHTHEEPFTVMSLKNDLSSWRPETVLNPKHDVQAAQPIKFGLNILGWITTMATAPGSRAVQYPPDLSYFFYVMNTEKRWLKQLTHM